MAYTFMKAQGYEIGDSLLDEGGIEVARKAMESEGTGPNSFFPKTPGRCV